MNSPIEETPETVEALEAEIVAVEQELASLSGKIASAKAHQQATGEYADPEWWARVNARKRHTGQRHQALLRKAARLRREQREARGQTFEQAFVCAALAKLGPALFGEISDLAREVQRGR